MSVITKLTSKQKAKLPQYVEQWTTYEHCTEPADRPKAERALFDIYARANFSKPDIIWFQSPAEMCRAASLQEGAPVKKQIWDLVKKNVEMQTYKLVETAPSVEIILGLKNQIHSQIKNHVSKQVMLLSKNELNSCIFGQNDASLLSVYQFYRDEFKLHEETKAVSALWDLCQSAGWALPYDGTCLVSERPQDLQFDDQGLLHCEDGPAILYRDEFAIYSWHGTQLPKRFIMDRASIDPEEIITLENQQQRAAAATAAGWKRMIESLDPTIIDSAANGAILFDAKLPGRTAPTRFLYDHPPSKEPILAEVASTFQDIWDAQMWYALRGRASV